MEENAQKMCIRDSGHTELFYPVKRPMLPPPDFNLARVVETQDVLPVSYTHLKQRRVLLILRGYIPPADDDERLFVRRLGDLVPVSYTHLDVYKRQARC